MTRWSRHPLTWILLAAAGLRLSGLFWGLPASDGWDNDGFTPRNFLTALALTWTPGSFFTYPPLHAILLAIPSLPVAGWALAQAPSLSQHDVIATITQPAYATYFAVVGRLVNIAMSLGIIWCIGGMATLVAGRRAGLFAAGAATLNFALTYYGQVGNLDVPCLFWGVASLWAAMQAMALRQPKMLWWAALLTAAAIATKDQAYGLFALAAPLGIALWFAMDDWPRRNVRAVLVPLLLASAAGLLALLLVDGAITNPSGFARRVAFLTGPASSGYAEYVAGPAGWWALLKDMARYYQPGAIGVALAAIGLALAGLRTKNGVRAAVLLPFLAIVSFTVCFNFAALRSDTRFLLPQGVLACVYVGIAVSYLMQARPWLRWGGLAVVAVAALLALHRAVGINAALWQDPRYDAERWMAAHVAPGDTIQTYGQNAFLPRFPARAVVTRVGQGSLKVRNPLPGVTELQAPFGAVGKPRFIVVSGVWVRRYLQSERVLPRGRIYSRLQQDDFHDTAARAYFAALDNGRLGYRLSHVSRYEAGFWPRVHIHDSLAEPIGIYERLP